MAKSFDKFLEELKKVDANLITESVIQELQETFDAAVEIRASELKNTLKEEMLEEAKELRDGELQEAKELRDEIITEAEEFKSKLVETLDTFTEDTVNEFMENYGEKVEDEIKLVFYENFYNTVKNQLEKSNIEFSESDINVIDSLKEEIESKNETINEHISEIQDLKEEILVQKCKSIIQEKTKDMIESDKEKLYQIMEDVEFSSEDECSRKIDLFIEKFNGTFNTESDNDVFNTTNIKKSTSIPNDEIVNKWANLI